MIDVAREAEVSHQTVSRVINDHPSVASETRERVLKVIQELNYRPSRVARSLAAKQTRTLALVAYDMSYYGPTQMVINIEKAVRISLKISRFLYRFFRQVKSFAGIVMRSYQHSRQFANHSTL